MLATRVVGGAVSSAQMVLTVSFATDAVCKVLNFVIVWLLTYSMEQSPS